MPGGYSQLCGHHVFLSSGKLLSVGGGGYGYNVLARAGYVFDPPSKTWTRTANDMSEAKWYPTAVALGDERVLVTCGDRGGDMDIYSEATNTFSTATGVWNNIQTASPNRTKGMSVLVLSSTPPYVRVMVIGGVGGDQGTYEVADVTSLSGAASWGGATPFPDGIDRSLASAVLLPNGTVFVAGGTTTTNSPCSLFNTATSAWTALAELPSARNYHSVALLLPSGQVMMAGWNNTKVEIFSPPYVFASRPTISAAPDLVHHGADLHHLVARGRDDHQGRAGATDGRHPPDRQRAEGDRDGQPSRPRQPEPDHRHRAERPASAFPGPEGSLPALRGQRVRDALGGAVDLPPLIRSAAPAGIKAQPGRPSLDRRRPAPALFRPRLSDQPGDLLSLVRSSGSAAPWTRR
ncbi:MAG: hypothetical protein ACRD03_07565 [Acidimicrobiales bacterium]